MLRGGQGDVARDVTVAEVSAPASLAAMSNPSRG